MPSLAARALRLYYRRTVKPGPLEPEAMVRHYRKAFARRLPARLPRGVARRPLVAKELGDTRGEWIAVPAPRCSVLHHHGGGYIGGRLSTYRPYAGALAQRLGAEVLLARYRLAPEHPYPAALEDAFATYRALLGRVDPARLVLSGDSAGGGLSLALLQRVRDAGLPLPAAAVLLSPWTDLANDLPSHRANDEADDMLSALAIRALAEAYLAGADPRDPGASPGLGDLGGLPPILVTVDESEVLLDDAVRSVEGVRAAGGEARLIRRSGLIHVWPVAVPVVPEARETVAEIAAFLGDRLA